MKKKLFIIGFVFLIFSFAIATASSPDALQTSAYWGFDTSAINATDYTPNNWDGDINGATFNSSGKYLGAYSFDGNNDYMNFSWREITGSSDRTFCTWLKQETGHASKEVLFNYGSSAVGQDWQISIESNIIGARLFGTFQLFTATNVNDGNWHFVCLGLEGTQTQDTFAYMDGNILGVSSSSTPTTTINTGTGAALRYGSDIVLSQNFYGVLDEFSIFEYALNKSEMDYLYNGGSPTSSQQYPFIDIQPFELNAFNIYNSTKILEFNATISNATVIQNITTTNGSIFWPLNDTINITVFSDTYFNASYIDINTSIDFDAQLYQSIVNFQAINIVDNSTIENFNVTIESIFNKSVNNVSTFLLNAGTYTYTARGEGIDFNTTDTFNISILQNLTLNISFSPNRINVTAVDLFTNVSIQNFSVRFVNDDGSIDQNISTNTGEILFPAVEDLYELTITSGKYSTQTTFVNLTVPQYNITFRLYETDTVTFNIIEEISRNEVTTGIDFELYGNFYSINGTYTGGLLVLDEIPDDTYEIRYAINNSIYCQRSYYFRTPLREPSETNFTLFVLETNESFQFVRVVTDQNALAYDQGYLQMQRAYVSDNTSGFFYDTMEIANIGSDGNSVFCAIPNIQPYRFRILDEDLLLADVKQPTFLVDANSEIIAQTAPELMETFYSTGTIISYLIYDNNTNFYVFDYTDPTPVADLYCVEYVLTSKTQSNRTSVCGTFNSATLLLEIPMVNGSYMVNAYVVINDEKSILHTDTLIIGFDDSGINIFGLLGVVLYLLVIVVCATMSQYTNPTIPIIFSLVSTAVFGFGFLGIVYITTPLIGGLLFVSVLMLWIFKEGK